MTLTSEPLITREEERLMGIVAAYFRRCHVYDYQICSCSYKGNLYPANEQEKERVNGNAEYIIGDLCDKHALTRQELLEATRLYARYCQ